MVKGNIPWQGIRANTKHERQDAVLKMKSEIAIRDLTNNLPIQLAQFMYYCRNLKFDETPSYHNLHRLLKEAFSKTSYLGIFDFDWNLMKRSEERRVGKECLCLCRAR